MEVIITGVSVGVILIGVNLLIAYVKNKKSKDNKAIGLLLKCSLYTLIALKKTGTINGDCDDVLDELNEFLIKK